MGYKLLVFLVCLSVWELVSATDYCNANLCGSSKHIACNNNGQYASTCGSNPAIVDINEAMRQSIVDAHNAKRNFIAGGNDPNHDSACRMAKIQWDPELAKLAELNVKQCQMKHDSCHNTDTFKWSGQNLAWFGATGTFNYAQKAVDSVQMWYDEVANSNMNYINSYPSSTPPAVIGHFTVMVADKNTHVGCAASVYKENGSRYNSFLFACNYAQTNIMGLPVYKSCAKSGSSCTTGTDSKYNNLCSSNEKIDPNDIWG